MSKKVSFAKTKVSFIKTKVSSTKTKVSSTKTKEFFKINGLKSISKKVNAECDTYDHYRIDPHVLGEGSYGKVMPACDGQTCEDVAKLITFDENRFTEQYRHNVFFAECAITDFAGKKGFGIPVRAYYLCDHGKKGVIIMERYRRDLFEIRNELTFDEMKQLIDNVRTMHNYGILHRDLFLKNTMYKRDKDGKRDIRIIDFGMAIPFEKTIPEIFRAIDYINLLSDLSDPELRKQCITYIARFIKIKTLIEAEEWVKSHYATCKSEYALLQHIPLHWIQLIGPATVDTLVWSVRCAPELDKDIVQKTEEKVNSVLSK
jgi:serine/threonine protein kinase